MNYDVKELKDIIQMNQDTLKEYLDLHLQDLGYTTVNKKGFLYAEGDIPVLLVAHLDTVHSEKAEIICFSEDMRYVMSPQGIGGDDRCGVYMIMQLIRDYKCHVLFCEDEEVGGRGANKFVASKLKPRVNFIVEMDRRGSNDAVFYHCDNPDFTDFVLSFGFEENHGTFSDISVIAPPLNTAAVNISAGYYNEHRLFEYIDMLAVENNIRRIGEMIMADSEHFEFIKRTHDDRQLSMFGDWGWRPMDLSLDSNESKRKMLMKLPEECRLVTNGCEIDGGSRYYIDRENNVYIYLEELDAAVESEHTFACDDNGEQIRFMVNHAKKYSVITMEDALERLALVH